MRDLWDNISINSTKIFSSGVVSHTLGVLSRQSDIYYMYVKYTWKVNTIKLSSYAD